jgi:mRNA interferase MazF
VTNYVPEIGDIVWVNFSPQAGREQAGHRPALVLSDTVYNRKTGLIVACPITNQPKGYVFEVPLPRDAKIQGAILVDHIRNLDWRARGANHAERASPQTMREVRNRLAKLLHIRSSPV